MNCFDSELESIHTTRKFPARNTPIWQEGTIEFNQKLAVAEDLLNVFWKDRQIDSNYVVACTKALAITNLRKCFDSMGKHVEITKEKTDSFFHDHSTHSANIMQSFVEVQKLFQFTETMAAYKLLFDCLYPSEMKSMGDGKMIQTNVKYHNLLQITSLYGFKLNS